MGESGSGKTTLLNILAALDKATSGTILLDGMNLSTIRDAAMAKFRRDNLGYVFQDFNLLDTFTLEDNIYLPLVLAGKRHSDMKARLDKLAPALGITDLLKKYPGIDIRGMYSPPFRKLSEEEDAADIERINASGADIIWIGLGAPKQENWMHAHKDKINGVMMGVGAGFDFHAGTIRRAPKWVQKIGLEWLYRMSQDPKRLSRRYLVTNTKFMYYNLVDRIKGRK